MTLSSTLDRTPAIAATDEPQRFDRRAVSYCDIWDLVAPGEQCPACADTFAERLARATSR